MGKLGREIANGIGDLTGANRAAEGAQRAAMERQALANKQYDFAQTFGKDLRNQAMDLSKASPQELAALEQSSNLQSKGLNEQAQLFSALDPAIMEASKQALGLLKGQEAGTLAPLRKQRDRQRQKLLDSLREQLGPGAETSSAGIQALANFDLDTSSQLENAQQSSLGQLFGMGSQGAQARSSLVQGYQGAARNALGVSQGYGGISSRQAQALLGAGGIQAGMLSSAMQGQLGTAGAKHTAETLKGQSQMNFMSGLLNAGATAGFSKLFNGSPATGGTNVGTGTMAGQSYFDPSNIG